MPIPTLWLICGLLTCLAGVLVVLGWRGRRVGDHRYCRRCGYDLFGCGETTTACPECGADLTRRRAVRVGLRQRRWKVLTAGVLLLLLAGGIAGTDYWLHNKGRTWYSIAPERVLFADTTYIEDRNAVQELVWRFNRNQLSPSNNAMLFELFFEEVISNPQADAEIKDSAWSVMSKIAGDGQIAPSRWEQALAVRLLSAFQMRKQVGRDRPVVLTFYRDITQPWDEQFVNIDQSTPIVLEIRKIGDDHWRQNVQIDWRLNPGRIFKGSSQAMTMVRRNSDIPAAITLPVTLSPGRYIFRMPETNWRYDFFDMFGIRKKFSTPFILPGHDFHVEVVDRETTVELHHDERVAELLHHLLPRGALHSLMFYLSHAHPGLDLPCPLVYDLIIRTAEREQTVATLVVQPQARSHFRYQLLFLPTGEDQKSSLPVKRDLILRPNPEAAEMLPGIHRILGNEIIIEDVLPYAPSLPE